MKVAYTETEKRAIQLVQMTGQMETMKSLAKSMDALAKLIVLLEHVKYMDSTEEAKTEFEFLKKTFDTLMPVLASFDKSTDKKIAELGDFDLINDIGSLVAFDQLVERMKDLDTSSVDDNVVAFPAPKGVM